MLPRPTIARLPLEVFVGVLVDHLQLLLPAIDRGIRLTAVLLLLHGATPVSFGDTMPFREGVPIGDSRHLTRVAAYDAKPYAFSVTRRNLP